MWWYQLLLRDMIQRLQTLQGNHVVLGHVSCIHSCYILHLSKPYIRLRVKHSVRDDRYQLFRKPSAISNTSPNPENVVLQNISIAFPISKNSNGSKSHVLHYLIKAMWLRFLTGQPCLRQYSIPQIPLYYLGNWMILRQAKRSFSSNLSHLTRLYLIDLCIFYLRVEIRISRCTFSYYFLPYTGSQSRENPSFTLTAKFSVEVWILLNIPTWVILRIFVS